MFKLIFQSAFVLCIALLFTQCKKNNEVLVTPATAGTVKPVNDAVAAGNSKANKQTNCPDLEVTEIREDTMASGNPA